ncbi:unnamed protein product [Clonostachys byssicola]|uniref:Uncharacterized protein n=1 Tax=Clonostachys byssicola TaxID=160290 RepID=A0A9N9UIJ1_9HYPO|nr:unnamed protein product [Clonostachys byssicola]
MGGASRDVGGRGEKGKREEVKHKPMEMKMDKGRRGREVAEDESASPCCDDCDEDCTTKKETLEEEKKKAKQKA